MYQIKALNVGNLFLVQLFSKNAVFCNVPNNQYVPLRLG